MFEAEEKSRMDKFFEIHNETKGKLPSLPFAAMKEYILGKTYELSLVFVPDETSTQLNFSYRGKNKPTNVLAFPLSKTEGEIFINPNKAKEEAREWSKTYEKFIGFLFIHGLLHLKGLDHGDEMEKLEKEACSKFGM